MTNREYATKNEAFIQACKDAGTKPTARQASKYRRSFGKAVRASKKENPT